jgi:hypothetical protein
MFEIRITNLLLRFREWKFIHPEGRCIPIKKPYGYSIRFAKVGGTSVFSRQVLYTMVITNLISLLLGTGIGYIIIMQFFGYFMK